jgi:hypothetical protein
VLHVKVVAIALLSVGWWRHLHCYNTDVGQALAEHT